MISTILSRITWDIIPKKDAEMRIGHDGQETKGHQERSIVSGLAFPQDSRMPGTLWRNDLPAQRYTMAITESIQHELTALRADSLPEPETTALECQM